MKRILAGQHTTTAQIGYRAMFALFYIIVLSPSALALEVDKTWTQKEQILIQSLALDRLPPLRDPGNRYLNNKDAAKLGARLFFDKRLSRNGQVSCATCHQPGNYFTDQRTLALGQNIGRRNTPSLHGVAYNSWFFWDGRKDSLWSQALAPLEDPAEHNFSRSALVDLVSKDADYSRFYKALSDMIISPPVQAVTAHAQPSGDISQIQAWKALSLPQRQQIDRVFANTGKALAAYVATLQPLTNRFDAYAKSLQQERPGNHTLLKHDELQGLRLFIGKAGCVNCHSGPLFTNQSFHNIGSGGQGDSGRAAVISRVKLDRFNCLGEYSDAPPDHCQELRFMQTDRHQLWGSFKTPTLRNVSNTAPYFHDGRHQTLAAVLEHYTTVKADQTHLPAIILDQQEKQELIAFLKTLAADPSGM